MLWLDNIDLNRNQILNMVVQNLASAPSSPITGLYYFDTTLGHARVYNGSGWEQASGASGSGTVTQVTFASVPAWLTASVATNTTTPAITLSATSAQTANQVLATPNGSTGTVALRTLDHNWISDFDTQVRTSRLDQLAVPTAAVSLNSQRITNLTDPSSAQDAATKNYVDITIQGLTPKPTATVATTAALPANTYSNGTSGVGATITTNANGAVTVDGYTLAAGDIVLVKDESTGSHNGLYCVDTETEILTTEGFKRYNQLNGSERVLTLNTKTGLSEWQDLIAVHKFDAQKRPVLKLEGPQHSSISTLNHRWPVKDRQDRISIKSSENLSYGDKIVRAVPCWNLPEKPVHNDSLVELVAWFICEGQIRRLDSGKIGENIRITQSHIVNNHYVEKIRKCLFSLFGEADYDLYGKLHRYAWREHVDGRSIVFSLNVTASRVLLELAPDKIPLPSFISSLTQAQLDLFITACICADGHFPSNAKTLYFTQKSQARTDMVQMAAILAGCSTNIAQKRVSDGTSVLSISTVRPNICPLFGLYGHASRYEVEKVDFEGELWCPETPNGTWFARRRGTAYYTGNTVTQAGDASHALILTRHVDMDTAAEFPTAFIPVEDAGTTNANSLWLCTNTAAPTVGTTAITFIELNKAADLAAGSNITISGNTVSLSSRSALSVIGRSANSTGNAADIVGTANQALVVNSGGTALAFGQVNLASSAAVTGTLPLANGGLAATTASGARTTIGAVGKYSALIGDGSSTSITVTQATHGLASDRTNLAIISDASTGAQVGCDVTYSSNGDVVFAFSTAPASNAYRITIVG